MKNFLIKINFQKKTFMKEPTGGSKLELLIEIVPELFF